MSKQEWDWPKDSWIASWWFRIDPLWIDMIMMKGALNRTWSCMIIQYRITSAVRERISLLRLNLNEAVIPEHLGARAVGINADIEQSIEDICRAMNYS